MGRQYLLITHLVCICLFVNPTVSVSSSTVDVIVCNGYKDDEVNGHGVGKVRDSRVHHLNLYKQSNWCVFDDSYITCEHGNKKEVSERIEGATYSKITIDRISGKIEEQRLGIWQRNFMNLRFEGICAAGTKQF